jgi:hypothetical protein
MRGEGSCVKNVRLCYKRESSCEVSTQTCDNCGQPVPCLVVDTSAGEYGSVAYCLVCITNEFKQHEEKQCQVT